MQISKYSPICHLQRDCTPLTLEEMSVSLVSLMDPKKKGIKKGLKGNALHEINVIE